MHTYHFKNKRVNLLSLSYNFNIIWRRCHTKQSPSHGRIHTRWAVIATIHTKVFHWYFRSDCIILAKESVERMDTMFGFIYGRRSICKHNVTNKIGFYEPRTYVKLRKYVCAAKIFRHFRSQKSIFYNGTIFAITCHIYLTESTHAIRFHMMEIIIICDDQICYSGVISDDWWSFIVFQCYRDTVNERLIQIEDFFNG